MLIQLVKDHKNLPYTSLGLDPNPLTKNERLDPDPHQMTRTIQPSLQRAGSGTAKCILKCYVWRVCSRFPVCVSIHNNGDARVDGLGYFLNQLPS